MNRTVSILLAILLCAVLIVSCDSDKAGGNTPQSGPSAKMTESYRIGRDNFHFVTGMHYSISQTTAITTLADELEATRSYLELRLMRSPGLFSYNIYVPPAHMECMIPKLILQPIVENAITHGFVEQGRTYQLSIVSYVKDGHLYIAVNNDGAEIPSSRVDEIRSGNITPSPKSHGIGLTNVFERLRLNSNMSVGGFVESSAGNGTTTTLDLGGLSMSDSRV